MNGFAPIRRESPLVLASESPRRKALLEQMNIPFIAVPSNIDEDSITGPPAVTAKSLAERKAMAVRGSAGGRWILGADTIVVSGGRLLGKPANIDEARCMLRMLSGKDHEVITGYAIVHPSGDLACTDCETTSVSIKTLTSREIDSYIATKEPFGKAGSYAIQGIGAFMVEGIRGSYSNVVGLPMCAVIRRFIDAGALSEFPLRLFA